MLGYSARLPALLTAEDKAGLGHYLATKYKFHQLDNETKSANTAGFAKLSSKSRIC